MATIAAIVGRICLALLFILSGLNKVMDPASTAEYITAQTALPGSLAMPTGIFEIVAGLILANGFMTRLASAVLAGFTVLTILLFHFQVTDPAQAQAALKNLAIVGGLLMVFAYGQVRGRIGTLSERDKRLEAEVKAARAEGRAEGAIQCPTD
ncbi:MAG: DoxX family protein [Erythrobacter sp.]|nr:DoxX family protein [Erythrobacter sp.]